MSPTKQFLECDSWEHIFPGNKTKTARFCLSLQKLNQHADIRAFTSIGIKDNKGWRMTFRIEGEDILDSLLNENPDLINNPERYGISLTNSEPDWENAIRGHSLI